MRIGSYEEIALAAMGLICKIVIFTSTSERRHAARTEKTNLRSRDMLILSVIPSKFDNE